jgi:hypothetical protein
LMCFSPTADAARSSVSSSLPQVLR